MIRFIFFWLTFELNRKIVERLQYSSKIMRMLTKWHCGEIEEALEEAVEAAEKCSFDFVRFRLTPPPPLIILDLIYPFKINCNNFNAVLEGKAAFWPV